MTSDLDQAVSGKGLVAAFQQVVCLSTGAVIGYEALARWPGPENVAPLEIISHAAKTGRLNAFDRACIRAAAQGALSGNSSPGMLLLVNCEPATPCADLSQDTDVMAAADKFRLVFEITERGLLKNPRALLRKVAVLRSLGIAVALDDIGAHPDSVALLDVIAPDIVKLDLALVQRHPDRLQSKTVAAIREYHDRTGAVICAEGIETEEHLEQALSYGATLGQGFKFGVPGELSVHPSGFAWPAVGVSAHADANPSLFDRAAAGREVHTVREPILDGLLAQMQHLAAKAEFPPIVLTAVGRQGIGERTQRKYRCIAEKSPFVAVFGHDVPDGLGHRVRTVRLDPDDPLSTETAIVVLGPETAVALVAREHRSDNGDTGAQVFDVVFVFDREHAAVLARSLLERPSPTISIHVDPARRKFASCTCGWQAKRRLLWLTALGDVTDHRSKTGHLPVDRLAG
ncbi:EAL domain-containing protein [Mycobacterium sp. 236(2023)]|uniref:EAL domain-containing protein n=1 Tax=Mycobacterium sp. 236(2023) TaxID=3038163 RepID=UPI002414FE1F|nr:EAL domain-containing protein [Mycobacterium sp. 236(2023)]MDG4664942.1 EAL domain-containing protein [Mycobacterium sp. 236(2023)]